jgi:hypothetical protein
MHGHTNVKLVKNQRGKSVMLRPPKKTVTSGILSDDYDDDNNKYLSFLVPGKSSRFWREILPESEAGVNY